MTVYLTVHIKLSFFSQQSEMSTVYINFNAYEYQIKYSIRLSAGFFFTGQPVI